MSELDDSVKKYEAALSLLFYEGQIGWQMNVVFIAINAVIINLLLKDKNQFDNIYSIILGAIGLIISIIWLFTFKRNSRYYHFRMAQAREAEPEEWKLLSERGFDFSKGKSIIIEKGVDLENYSKDKFHKLTLFEKKAKNKYSMLLVLWFSILLYLYLTLYSFYKMGILNKIKFSYMIDSSALFSGLVPSIVTCLVTSLILLWAYKKQFKIFEQQVLEQRKQINEQSRQIDNQLSIARNQSSMSMMLKLDKEFNSDGLKTIRRDIGKKISAKPNMLNGNNIDYKTESLIDLEDIFDFFETVSLFVEKKYIYEEDAWHFFDAWFTKYYEFYIKYNIKANSNRENTVWSGLSRLKGIFDKIEKEKGAERETIELEDLKQFFVEEASL